MRDHHPSHYDSDTRVILQSLDPLHTRRGVCTASAREGVTEEHRKELKSRQFEIFATSTTFARGESAKQSAIPKPQPHARSLVDDGARCRCRRCNVFVSFVNHIGCTTVIFITSFFFGGRGLRTTWPYVSQHYHWGQQLDEEKVGLQWNLIHNCNTLFYVCHAQSSPQGG